jgi:hypothetical protein
MTKQQFSSFQDQKQNDKVFKKQKLLTQHNFSIGNIKDANLIYKEVDEELDEEKEKQQKSVNKEDEIFCKHSHICENNSFNNNNFINNNFNNSPKFSYLPLEFWERTEECKDAKSKHMFRVDNIGITREQVIRLTSLYDEDIVLERNMFPYNTPSCIEHFTLWSNTDLSHNEILHFVDKWISIFKPHVRRWQYDDNQGERSFQIFHVHVFIEIIPFCFTPSPGQEYIPPHLCE